ncbi:unnamed protein product [Oppiella nova]|uniref:non-specific serine/threonine protein kinase n=1 Tax=Oppiella nova TaxID=334625 RepID=A0A7R9QSW8_9ACAR|nr:unnamed protein product [Oppiella nova]CAG2173176.1 unnamed protein product [Oppiella nova]
MESKNASKDLKGTPNVFGPKDSKKPSKSGSIGFDKTSKDSSEKSKTESKPKTDSKPKADDKSDSKSGAKTHDSKSDVKKSEKSLDPKVGTQSDSKSSEKKASTSKGHDLKAVPIGKDLKSTPNVWKSDTKDTKPDSKISSDFKISSKESKDFEYEDMSSPKSDIKSVDKSKSYHSLGKSLALGSEGSSSGVKPFGASIGKSDESPMTPSEGPSSGVKPFGGSIGKSAESEVTQSEEAAVEALEPQPDDEVGGQGRNRRYKLIGSLVGMAIVFAITIEMTDSEDDKQLIGKCIANNKYMLTAYVGSGSFSAIYKVIEVNTNKELVVKLESMDTKTPQLSHEFCMYQLLRYECNHWSIPKTYFFGEFLTYRALVLEQLGHNLCLKFEECGQVFSVKTVTLLAIQLMDIFEYIHSRRIVYRDVKPDNLLLGMAGTAGANRLHVVDFGLAKEYKDRNGAHIPYKEEVSLTGTARYISINTHLYREQSRRDDMEAVGHLLIYFLRGTLPWSGLDIKDTVKRFETIGAIKQKTTPEVLCANFPQEFAMYLTAVRSLGFDEEPKYETFRHMFEQIVTKSGDKVDNCYDWMDTKRTTRPASSVKTESNTTLNEDINKL